MPAPSAQRAEFSLTDVPAQLTGTDGWDALRRAIQMGEAGGIDGAWGSSGAAAVAALTNEMTAPLLVIVPNLTDVGPWQEDLAGFSGTRPVVFPAFETWPVVERAGKIAPETGQRLRVLQGLLKDALTPGPSPTRLEDSAEEREKKTPLLPPPLPDVGEGAGG